MKKWQQNLICYVTVRKKDYSLFTTYNGILKYLQFNFMQTKLHLLISSYNIALYTGIILLQSYFPFSSPLHIYIYLPCKTKCIIPETNFFKRICSLSSFSFFEIENYFIEEIICCYLMSKSEKEIGSET